MLLPGGAAVLAMVPVVLVGVSTPAQPAVASTPSLATVETLAGPVFCPGTGVREPASSEVRAMAVDDDGRIFVNTGPMDAGLVVVADPGLGARPLYIGTPSATPKAVPESGVRREAPAPASAPSSFVADGTGGIIVAFGSHIVQVDSGNGVTTIAGTAVPHDGDGPASSGDGGLSRDARFTSARSIARDDAGNLYIADQTDPELGTVRIRFVNRVREPVSFYPGTDQQRTVLPGHIDTIAGAAGVGSSRDGGPALEATLQGSSPAMALVDAQLYVALHVARPPADAPSTTVRLANLGGTPVTAHGATLRAGEIHTIVASDASGPGDGAGALQSRPLGHVPAIAADDQGNLFLADETNHRIWRVDPAGDITTFAGTGTGAFNGNGGPAAAAQLDRPYDVEAGPAGRIYISDQGSGQVRFVDQGGVIHAALGRGAGDVWICRGGSDAERPATTAPLVPVKGTPATLAPSGIDADDEGNVFVAIPDGHQVKKIDRSGVVTTVMGAAKPHDSCSAVLGCPGFSGDSGPAAAARLEVPVAVATGSDQRLYVLDGGNARVRLANLGESPVTAHGITVAPGSVETVAGNGTAGMGGDGGDARKAQLSGPQTLQSAREFFAPTQEQVPEFFAHAERFPATAFNPLGNEGLGTVLGSVAADDGGNLYIADTGNHRVRRVDAGGRITTIAGDGAKGALGDCCRFPVALAVGPGGSLYVSDLAHVWMLNMGDSILTAHGQTVRPGQATVIAGNGETGLAGDQGPAVEAQLQGPLGLAADANGTLYITEISAVRTVDPAGKIGIVVGGGQRGFNGDGLKGQPTRVNFVTDAAVDGCGNLAFADRGNHRVRRLAIRPDCHSKQGIAVSGPASSSWTSVPVLSTVGAAGLASAGVVLLAIRRRRRSGRAQQADSAATSETRGASNEAQ